MNKITIIGNLTADPKMREVNTAQGVMSVCSFTVAVNDRRSGEQNATFFNVTAWRKLGENCMTYLAKGRKVCVVGSVSVRAYSTQQGEARASLEVNAEDVEFLTAKDADPQAGARAAAYPAPAPAQVPMPVETDELPF